MAEMLFSPYDLINGYFCSYGSQEAPISDLHQLLTAEV